MSRITISNIAKHISHNPDDDYENEDGTDCVQFTWDYENEKIDKIASEEFRYAFGDKKKNLMWVKKLKEVADWKEGEYIYAYTKTNADGYYNVFYKKDKVKFSWFNTIIEPSGYVCMEAFNHYTMDTDDDIKHKVFVRIDSVYNDKNSVKPKEKAKPKKEKAKPKKEKAKPKIGFCSDCREELVEGYYWSRPDRNLKFCADCGEWVLNEEKEEEEEEAMENTCECCGASDNSVGLATGENGVEMWVCRFCDVDGSNYDGWGDVECTERNLMFCADWGEEEEEEEEEKCVPVCATCGCEMDPFLICLLNFGNHNQSVYHCTECLEDTPALMERMRIIVQNEYGKMTNKQLYEWIILNKKPDHKIRKNQKKEELLNLIVLIKTKII